MTLYVRTGCRFCAHVLAVVAELGLTVEEKNVADPGVTEELIRLGGKKQEPYLVDGEVAMYESDAIVEYLREHYSK
jgi:glutathione S-transferase